MFTTSTMSAWGPSGPTQATVFMLMRPYFLFSGFLPVARSSSGKILSGTGSHTVFAEHTSHIRVRRWVIWKTDRNLVECSHVTVLARSAFEKDACVTSLQFLLSRKPNAPVVAWVQHFDSIKIAFGTNAILPHYAADRFLTAAHPLQVNLLPGGQRTLRRQTAIATANIYRLHNVVEVSHHQDPYRRSLR